MTFKIWVTLLIKSPNIKTGLSGRTKVPVMVRAVVIIIAIPIDWLWHNNHRNIKTNFFHFIAVNYKWSKLKPSVIPFARVGRKLCDILKFDCWQNNDSLSAGHILKVIIRIKYFENNSSLNFNQWLRNKSLQLKNLRKFFCSHFLRNFCSHNIRAIRFFCLFKRMME